MKKIAIHVVNLRRDGAQRVTVHLAKYFIARGIDCTIITENTAEDEYPLPNGTHRISLGITGNKYLGYFNNILHFRKILREEHPDLLLVMDTPGCLLSIPAVRGLGIKTVVSERNDPSHFPGKPFVAKVSRLLMSKADGYVFQTEDAAEYYEYFAKGRSAVIPNPIYTDEIPDPYLGERKPEIVAVGRLTAQKNQQLLIRAFAKLHSEYPDWRLTIYGEGELRDDLVSLSERLGVDRFVTLPGNKSDVLLRIRDAAIFVMPSNFEGMPNALLEAMALGLPCIATDCPIGGPRAIISNGINGILIGVNSIDQLTGALHGLMSRPEEGAALGSAAVSVREKYNASSICARWLEYLEQV